jgi:hypothetical protein
MHRLRDRPCIFLLRDLAPRESILLDVAMVGSTAAAEDCEVAVPATQLPILAAEFDWITVVQIFGLIELSAWLRFDALARMPRNRSDDGKHRPGPIIGAVAEPAAP